MKFVYKKTKVFYKVFGQGEPLVLLHGWQSSMDAFLLLAEELKYQYKIVMIDFPPFGKSGQLQFAWSVDDYSDMVDCLLKKLGIQDFCILAHSFGGRVAINLCTCYNCNVKKLILTGGTGLKPKRGLLYKIRVRKYKRLRKKNANLENFGSEDYRALSPLMKQTFVKVVNFFQDKLVKKITCPTLLVYGSKDDQTPLYVARRFERLIKNSRLEIFENEGHFCFLTQHEKFFDIVNGFLKY